MELAGLHPLGARHTLTKLGEGELSSSGKSMPTKRRGTAGSTTAELRPPGRRLRWNAFCLLPERDAPL
jgi:hypothetical protein